MMVSKCNFSVNIPLSEHSLTSVCKIHLRVSLLDTREDKAVAELLFLAVIKLQT